MFWLSLTPPLVVFILGFWTKKIARSLFVGVLVAALIATGGAPFSALSLTIQRLWGNLQLGGLTSFEGLASSNNFCILVFVLSLGIIIELIRHCHAVDAFVNFSEKKIRTKRAAETSSLLLSHCLCIDDYLSSLTVGSVMRPLTDRFRIPRVKLAFLTDSMAAPVAMVAPVSSWSAAIIAFLIDNGIHDELGADTLLVANPYHVYLNILPYVIYSITLIISLWWIVQMRLSFGAMRDHEQLAEKTGNLGNDESLTQPSSLSKVPARFSDFLMPMVTLFGSTFSLLLYFGGWQPFAGVSMLAALQQAPIAYVLFLSGLTTLFLTTVYYLFRGLLRGSLSAVYYRGFRLMFPVCLILLYSWTLGALLRQELFVGEQLATLLSGTVSVNLMPFILFLNATMISLALGSSWATTAILVPIALPMVMSMSHVAAPATLDQLPILFPVMGAILSGAVCGDHISLISETTVMAATSAGCNCIDHVKTQGLYSLPIVIGTGAGFLALGFLIQSSGVALISSLTISVTVSLSLLTAAHFVREKRALLEVE